MMFLVFKTLTKKFSPKTVLIVAGCLLASFVLIGIIRGAISKRVSEERVNTVATARQNAMEDFNATRQNAMEDFNASTDMVDMMEVFESKKAQFSAELESAKAAFQDTQDTSNFEAAKEQYEQMQQLLETQP